MDYLINESIEYNSSDGTLFSPENSIDMITLNRVTNELLLLFIQNNGVPISRNKLLNELWEKKGLNASGNNLNHYVSLLRKILTQHGCTDVITTIPKHGFIFEATVSQIEPSLHLPAISTEDFESHQQEDDRIFLDETRKPPHFFTAKKVKIALLILVLMSGTITPFVLETLRLHSVRSEVFRMQQCRFYLIDDLTRRFERDWVVNRMKSIIVDEKINCSLKTNVYYSADKKRNVAGDFVMHDLLVYCAFKSKAPCENYIYTRREGAYENKN
jgi:DNA-binding winged helix-turn-helix (wHTH) protein